MNLQYTNALGVISLEERNDSGVMKAGVVFLHKCQGRPSDTGTGWIFVAIAMFQVEMNGQGKLLTPLQTCGDELLVVVFYED